MSCNFPSETIHGYLDGELDAVRAAEFERHLEQCPECVAALDAHTAFAPPLEQAILPNTNKIVDAIRNLAAY